MEKDLKFVKSYFLRLADGSGWNIMASKKAENWLDTMASIMKLKELYISNCPRLIFTRTGEGSIPKLSLDGWRVQDLKMLRFGYHNQIPDVICELNEDRDKANEFIKMWFVVFPIYRRIQSTGGLPLHAALIEKNGKGMLFLASGGTGKSTCAKRIPSPWRAHSDDVALVVKNSEGQYLAHPYPTWSDYFTQRSEGSWNVEKPVKMSAIFFLERSDKDKVIPVQKVEAAIKINRSVSEICRVDLMSLEAKEQREMRIKLFDNACALAKSVPAFKLQASLTGRFWEEIEDAVG